MGAKEAARRAAQAWSRLPCSARRRPPPPRTEGPAAAPVGVGASLEYADGGAEEALDEARGLERALRALDATVEEAAARAGARAGDPTAAAHALRARGFDAERAEALLLALADPRAEPPEPEWGAPGRRARGPRSGLDVLRRLCGAARAVLLCDVLGALLRDHPDRREALRASDDWAHAEPALDAAL